MRLTKAQQKTLESAFRRSSKRHSAVFYKYNATHIVSTIDGEYENGQVWACSFLDRAAEYRYYTMPYPHIEAKVHNEYVGALTVQEMNALIAALNACAKQGPLKTSDRELAPLVPFPIHWYTRSKWWNPPEIR